MATDPGSTGPDHLWGIVRQIRERVPLGAGDRVLDIGSNDGTLLKSYEIPGLHRIGIDPARDQFADHYPPDIRLIRDYFGTSIHPWVSPAVLAKVITSIVILYDLEAPMDFVSDIQRILHPDDIWVMEQSYMPTMLRMNAFDEGAQESEGA